MGELGYAHCSHIFTVLLSFNHTPYLKTLNALEWGFAKSFLEFAKGKKILSKKSSYSHWSTVIEHCCILFLFF